MPKAKKDTKVFEGAVKGILLKNVRGEDMPQADYFFLNESPEEEKRLALPENKKEKEWLDSGMIAPPYFNQTCGKPVDREDLIEVFDRIFLPEDNFLFYRCNEKEVYIVIVPLKFADIGAETGASTGDYQKHSVSFVMEGSANVDTLKLKLQRMAGTMKYTKER